MENRNMRRSVNNFRILQEESTATPVGRSNCPILLPSIPHFVIKPPLLLKLLDAVIIRISYVKREEDQTESN